MTPNEYQLQAMSTAVYPVNHGKAYAVIGLCNEAGEVAGKFKKYLRDGVAYAVIQQQIQDELGDVLWYVASVATEFDLSLASIMEGNLQKLADRKTRGVIGGSGDNR
jgi:Predicted pyrophosphatase